MVPGAKAVDVLLVEVEGVGLEEERDALLGDGGGVG